jgi:hypothetical protein
MAMSRRLNAMAPTISSSSEHDGSAAEGGADAECEGAEAQAE